MTSPWTIAPGATQVDLDAAGRGEVSFGVDNQGPTDQRLVFDVVPGDGTDRTWFKVAEPRVHVPHGKSASVLVRIGVPAGTAAGERSFAGRAYSADRAPEETSVVSDQVTVAIKAAAEVVPWWRRYWWALAAGSLVLVVIVVGSVLLLGGDDPPTQTTETSTTAAQPSVVRRTGPVAFNQTQGLDLDELVVAGATGNDLLYRPLAPSDGFIVALNGAALAKIGPSAQPGRDCAQAGLGTADVQVSTWVQGEVLCVRTDAGRLAFLILNQKVSLLSLPPPPPQLRLSVTTFE